MIRIVIAEDQEMLLGVIGSLLNLANDMEVVGQARTGEQALTLVQQLEPDVCIMDIEMFEMSNLLSTNAFIQTKCKFIILSNFVKTGYFDRARKAGIAGYLLKDTPSEQLIESIRSIMMGEQIYSSELMDKYTSDNEEVLEAEERMTDKLFANQVNKKSVSVRKYLSTIMEKMKLPTG